VQSGSGNSISTNSNYTNITVNDLNGDSGYASAGTITVNNPAGSVAGTNAPYIQLLACQKN